MNYIGIDPSLTSTAIFIKTPDAEYYFNFRNNDKLSKWHKVLSHVDYVYTDIKKSSVYSENEILKNIQYNSISLAIVKKILDICNPEDSVIFIEGYSYSSSNTSSLIDLIGFSTLLRHHLIQYKFDNITVISPSTLKIETCKLTYPAIEKHIGGKKPRIEYIYRNSIGIPGGSFKKPDMLESIFDNKNIDIQIKRSLSYHKDELLKMKAIPKPIDDLIDAVCLVYTNI